MTGGTLSVLGPGGHVEIRWDPDDPESVKTARAAFNELRAKGYTAFRMRKDGGAGAELKRFAPKANEIVIVGPIAGGA